MEKESKNQVLDELKRLVIGLSEQQQRRIFYVLDYVLNYYRRERITPELEELGFTDELIKLKEDGIIIETKEHYRARKIGEYKEYKILTVNPAHSETVRSLQIEKYYPLFSEQGIKEKLKEIISKSIIVSSELFNRIDDVEIGLSQEVSDLGKTLSENELGYFIGYRTSTYWEYSNKFIFRGKPLDVKRLFAEIFEEEFIKVFNQFTPIIKLCVYLETLNPNIYKEFIIRNAASRFNTGDE